MRCVVRRRSVSYTHLDVYKRQMFVCPAPIRSELAALGGSEAGAAAQARVCTLGEHLAAVQGLSLIHI